MIYTLSTALFHATVIAAMVRVWREQALGNTILIGFLMVMFIAIINMLERGNNHLRAEYDKIVKKMANDLANERNVRINAVHELNQIKYRLRFYKGQHQPSEAN